ncbi:MAG: 50S ribosomal protein L16 [Oligoflexia bacterium]|nr:50S ribosomal protein L16 [Oligoflexia bacterium]
MLSPKRVKWRKQQRGKMKGKALRGGTLLHGDYGLQAAECGYITARQIEAARIAVSKFTKKGGQMWIRIFPDKPRTKKPAEVRMGSGKGNVEDWVSVIKPGRILYEIKGVTPAEAVRAMQMANYKLPLKTKLYHERLRSQRL